MHVAATVARLLLGLLCCCRRGRFTLRTPATAWRRRRIHRRRLSNPFHELREQCATPSRCVASDQPVRSGRANHTRRVLVSVTDVFRLALCRCMEILSLPLSACSFHASPAGRCINDIHSPESDAQRIMGVYTSRNTARSGGRCMTGLDCGDVCPSY